MTTQPEDAISEWKRASGVWHYWAEKHFTERKSNPFMRRPAEAQEPSANTTTDSEGRHEL